MFLNIVFKFLQQFFNKNLKLIASGNAKKVKLEVIQFTVSKLATVDSFPVEPREVLQAERNFSVQTRFLKQ